LTKPVGQSSARGRVLGRVSDEPQTVSQIARIIGYARQSVQRVADDLASEGLAEYIANPSDQRAQLLKLTHKGQDVLRTIETEQQGWVKRLMAVLDEQELVKLAEQLMSISQYIAADYRQTYDKKTK
jgi:DNA-binding MarR family transcriptional regulator